MVWHACLRFLCSEMIDEGTTSIVCSYLRIWPTGTRTQSCASLLPSSSIIDRFPEIRHKESRLKVPFAVACHIYFRGW